MKGIRVIAVTLAVLQFASCSRLYDACVRNITNEVAVIDVFLLDKTDMKTLPNKVRMTNHIVNLKKGYKKYLDSMQNVTWVDVNHFQLHVQPRTTVDLSDMAGRFINSSPRGDAVVTVTSNLQTDTLLNGRYNIKSSKFNFQGSFFTPRLYYDIQPQEAPSTTTTISPFTALAEK